MKCMWKHCPHKAKYRVGLLLYAPGHYHAPPARGVTGLAVCTFCRKRIDVEDVLSDEGWNQIEQAFAENKKLAPERALTRLVFTPLLHEGGN